MSATDERKALDRLSQSYRRLITGGRPPRPPETPAEGQAQLPASTEQPQAEGGPESSPRG
jgi:hypothetical protein